MELRTLSASSASTYEGCPARWKAENLERTPRMDIAAGGLGRAVHQALEHWVASRDYLDWNFGVLCRHYDKAWYEHNSKQTSAYQEGLTLLNRWYDRSKDLLNRKVLSTEQKASFTIKVAGHEIPFNYIWDRADSRDDTIEVIDYKTGVLNLTPADLHSNLQARCYGLAAQIAHPSAERIWVTFDLLRYERVGTVFSKEDSKATWVYLRSLAERILDDDKAPEQLNHECRFCIRKHVCTTLNDHSKAGGVLSITDPIKAANRREELEIQRKTYEQMIGELDRVILDHCEREEIPGFLTDTVEVSIGASRRRAIDTSMATRILGPDVVADKAKLSVTAVDQLLKDPNLTDEKKSELKQLIFWNHGETKVHTKRKKAQ